MVDRYRYFVCRDCGVVEGHTSAEHIGRLEERHKDCSETAKLYINREKLYRSKNSIRDMLEWVLKGDAEDGE